MPASVTSSYVRSAIGGPAGGPRTKTEFREAKGPPEPTCLVALFAGSRGCWGLRKMPARDAAAMQRSASRRIAVRVLPTRWSMAAAQHSNHGQCSSCGGAAASDLRDMGKILNTTITTRSGSRASR
ncbi:hypothetical protein ACCO45_010117 [Purpureocillium lilacinum]|uniref:Uncharacterized protein n=1 Tax=Purpureocillium lilacinum TaxID=33203 RepID=A0ACC4DG32_PURLI